MCGVGVVCAAEFLLRGDAAVYCAGWNDSAQCMFHLELL
jgi:hypothetical protein